MSTIDNQTKFLECQRNILEYVRQFGFVYFGFLIVFGTIGNIISLLVIRGVGQSYHPDQHSIARKTSKAGSSRNSPYRIIRSNIRPSVRPPIIPSQASAVFTPSIPKRRPIRKHPSKSIFTALAIADTIALWVNPVRYWVLFVFGFDIRQNSSVILCRLHTFLTYATRDAAIWVLCLLTFERYLIGCHPYKAKIIWRGRRKLWVWIIIFAVLGTKNSTLLFILQLIYADPMGEFEIMGPDFEKMNSTKLLLCDTLSLKVRKAFFYLDIVIYSIVPTVLLLYLNVALYRVIQQRSVLSKRVPSSSKAGTMRNTQIEESMHASMVLQNSGPLNIKKSVVQANRLLIPVGVFHLITSVPICIFSIVEDAMQLKRSPSAYVRCVLNACGYLFVMLGAATYGVNCLIYFLSSSNFRERLYALTKQKCLFTRADRNSSFPKSKNSPNHPRISSASVLKEDNCKVSE
ncbi:hypothetical protein Aperf_G00000026285 [Anoplocephala perfoliata]